MSGGHWDYVGYRIQGGLLQIADDPAVKQRWPNLAELLGNLADALFGAERDMDWDLSGDKAIPDDAAFERRAVGAILETAMKAAPDDWFPRGKWATIQAIQGRQADPLGEAKP